MTHFVGIVALVSGLLVVGLVSGIFLWDYGAPGFAVPLRAALGTLIAMLTSQALFRRTMMGAASIVGGIIGSVVGGSAVGEAAVLPYTRSATSMAPYLVFIGSVLGGAIGVITFSVVPFNKEPKLRRPQGKCQHQIDRQEKTSEYFWVSLGSLVIGPVLGLVYFVIEYVSGNVETVDNWPVLGHQIRGPVGALLCAMSFGAIGGLLLGVPYFMVWLTQAVGQRVGGQSRAVK